MGIDAEALLAAFVPCAIWLAIVYSRDRYEREPKQLVIGLFFLAIVPVLAAAAVERGLHLTLRSPFVVVIVLSAIAVGLIEEGAKFATMWAVLRRSANVNEPVDGMIYAASVALGFAAFETTLYILAAYHRDLLLGAPAQVAFAKAFFFVAPLRAFTGALGHLSFTGIVGEAYGRYRSGGGSRRDVWVAYLQAAGLHAAYDALVLLAIGYLVLIGAIVQYVRLFRRAVSDSPFRWSQLATRPAGTAAGPPPA